MSIRKGQIIVAGAGNTRRNIGEVYYSQSSLATDNSGALPLWTGESVATAMYPSLTEWVTKHTELQCTAEEYESALATYGECPKYVLSTDSLRLPKLANYIKMANGIEGVTQSEAGLPNITGSVSGIRAGGWEAKGALKATHTSTTSQTMTNALNQHDLTVEIDASLSSTAYGKSDTVTPSHTTLYPWVVAYTASIEASVAQTAEFQNAISGKADTNLGNTIPSTSFKEMAVGWSMPDYENGIEVTNIAANVFVQVEKDSFVLVFGVDPYAENYYAYVSPDGGETKYIVGRRTDDHGSNTQTTSFTFFVPAGWYFSNGAEGGSRAFVYPLRGVKL